MKRFLLATAMVAMGLSPTLAQDFSWKAQSGKTVSFLSSNHPWANAVLAKRAEFEALTGIKVQVDTFQEAQMRQRLVTVLQGRSADVDLYMSLKSREGLQFANAGWYADLSRSQPYCDKPRIRYR